MADNRYSVDYGKKQAKCQKCKQPIPRNELRLAKITSNPFTGEGEMKQYHHPTCMFEAFKRARATTRLIEDVEDIEDFRKIKDEDKALIRKLLKDFENSKDSKSTSTTTPKKSTPKKEESHLPSPKVTPESRFALSGQPSWKAGFEFLPPTHKDNAFKEFRRICASIAVTSSYLAKTELVRKFFNSGTDGDGFKGDLLVWVRLLLPGVVKRIYNLQSKQLVKIFSRLFRVSEEKMLTDLEAGDVAETVAKFFEESKHVQPALKSVAKLTVHDVDLFLDRLSKLTKEDDQMQALSEITTVCTANDLKMVVRLIRGDLRIQAGAKHILDALHKDAYEAFNSFRNIDKVVGKILELRRSGNPCGPLEIGSSLMHPVQPMLALACKSVEMAFQKCPRGMFSEIKYDGERVQLHKQGEEFRYFSRSLKPVLHHKVAPFKDAIPQAFPKGDDLILDCEVLMVDNKTGKPLPFGTLGVHKAAGFKDASPCLFVFDCIYFNGQDLMSRPLKERRRLLQEHMTEVGNSVKFSEMKLITKKSELVEMIKDVLQQGLEGLVLKDPKGTYEPGKRHWLKVKKDYLNEGAMADSADLVVLGAWFGTGNKGGLMSVWLMGCYDDETRRWYTVTKVHTGHDDATLERLQKELASNMVKIKQDYDKVPTWLDCTRQMAPDFIVKDPKESPVWEITGAEFTKAEIHTADGISIRFPRVTKIRNDKDWTTATSLKELKTLFEASKASISLCLDESENPKKRKSDSDNDRETKKPKKETSRSRSRSKEREEKKDREGKKEKSDREEKKREKNGSSSDVNRNEATTLKRQLSDGSEAILGPSGKSFDKIQITTESGFVLKLERGDVFQVDDNTSLAHCISADFKLETGIAKTFRQKFCRIHELESTGSKVGHIAVLQDKERFIYNLVTKKKLENKGDFENLRRSLEAMKIHAREHRVKKIAIPKCGLDGLPWPAVRTLIKNVFKSEKMEICVKYLDASNSSDNDSPSKRLVESEPMSPKKAKMQQESHVKTPLLDIFEGKPLTRISKNDLK